MPVRCQRWLKTKESLLASLGLFLSAVLLQMLGSTIGGDIPWVFWLIASQAPVHDTGCHTQSSSIHDLPWVARHLALLLERLSTELLGGAS